jgi:Ca2+-binding RTX toxin-like protein
MPTFTGTSGDDLITTGAVSPGITSDDGSAGPTAQFSDDIDGGAGNDTIEAGGAIGDRDFIGGDEGNDLLISADGTLAWGGTGDDTLVGATNDVLFGEEGNDLLIAGDSTRGFGGDGDDHFLIPTDVSGAELHGEDGNDTFEATAGNDEVHGDAGDDVVNWTMTGPQTSNSLIDGGDGVDTFKVTATQDDQPATIELSNDGEGFDDIHVVRDAETWADSTDANLFTQNVEHIEIVAGRGADNIVVQDQTGLGVQQIDIDLGASATGGPDGQRDVATIGGTSDADHASVTTVGGAIVVSGLAASVKVSDIDHSAGVTDQVTVSTGFGDDVIDLARGADPAQLAALTVDGGDGVDTAAVTGTTAGEAFVLAANGDHATITQGGVSLGQLVNVETLDLKTLGGGDSVLINSLEGTAVQTVNVDLTNAAGQPDGVFDRVTFEDLAADDGVFVTQGADGHSLTIGEGTTSINVVGLDGQDQVIIHGNAGDDTLIASGVRNVAQITLNGGDGNDLVIGGDGAENLFGDAGDDTLQAGVGRNVIDGGAGDDLLINADGTIGVGGLGNDTIHGATNDVIQAGDGDDLISAGLSTQITAGAGEDTITAGIRTGNGASIDAGDGNDVFLGQTGNLLFNGGNGDDAIHWDMSGDISSNTLLDGGAGHDTLAITGPQDATSWTISVGNNGTGFDLFQLVHAGQTAKLFSQTTEDVSITSGNGADTVTVTDQTGLGVQTLRLFTEAGDDRIDLSAEHAFGTTTVDTGAGNDTVTGGAASDTFVFHADHSADVFKGFQAGDHVDLRDSADHSFADLVANGHIVQVGTDVVISDGAGTSLTLTGVELANLGQSDFLFG